MKYKVGDWVVVTRRREGTPDMEMLGKIIKATPDFAIAESWLTIDGERKMIRSTMSAATELMISFRKAKNSDFRRR